MSYTDFKEVTSNNIGSVTRYGGNDTKEIMQIFNNKVVTGRRISIKNPFRFTDSFDMVPPVSTPSSPTDANTSRIYADPSDAKIKVKKTSGTVVDIENLDIANAALQTITDKAKLHSQIFYKDQNNDIGAFYYDMAQMSTPSNPGAGVRRIFLDSATGQLSVRTPAGATVNLEGGGGGGGGGDVFLNSTNTYGDFDSVFASGRLKVKNPAGTFSYAFTGSGIGANRVLTIPLLTAGDVLVCEAVSQALTNKTIAAGSNTLTGIADANITAHTTTKITTTSKSLLNPNIVFNDQTNTYGAFDQQFKSSRLIVRNPGDTFSYIIAGSSIAANRTVTLPNLSADDTFSTLNSTGTVTNKTFNIDQNTLKHSTTNAAGDILTGNATQFNRLARGTALQVLRVNSGGTDIQWATLDSERVGKSTASGNASTTVFTIAHGLGSLPTYTFISVGASGTGTIAAKADSDATNITVTFASAPSSGTNNVIVYWRVVA